MVITLFLSADSWFDDGKNEDENGFVSGTGERVYSGSLGMERDGSGSQDGHSNQNASFSHKPPSASSHLTNGHQDDFFDSWQQVVYNLDLY